MSLVSFEDFDSSLIKDVVVPDTSVVVHGFISKLLSAGKISFKKILIHEAVIAELESQANKGKDSGLLGLEEISVIRDLALTKGFEIIFCGNRPNDFEIKFAKAGEIDSLIRDLAFKESATLLTADIVQGRVALAKGLSAVVFDVNKKISSLLIEQLFLDGAMSIHLRQGSFPFAKVGRPGAWEFVVVREEILSKEFLESLVEELFEFVKGDDFSFIESDKKFSSVLQIKNMRVVVVKKPLSDVFEVTATRPVSNLSLEDYDISSELKKRLFEKSEGLLISGPPGHGKSTFVQALAKEFVSMRRVVKTLESPRDLVVDESITRYSSSIGAQSELRDILLLARPDFVLFDEVRSVEDFRLFSDLRLSGIGMLGVVHASAPIDSVERFIGRLDLGMIPHVIDTVVFISKGVVEKVFSLSLCVKVPSGMFESDLARPVVVVSDFLSGVAEFEIYSYGDQVVVVPISASFKKPIHLIAERFLLSEFKVLGLSDVVVDFVSDSKCVVSVPKDDVLKVLGPRGSVVSGFEKKFRIKIDVLEKKACKSSSGCVSLNYSCSINSKHLVFDVVNSPSVLVSVFVDDVFVMNVKTSKSSQIKLALSSPHGSLLASAFNDKKSLKLFLSN